MKVSVIVPVYNVCNFIGSCAKSLLSQTLKDVEFIFVDDVSQDNSVDVLTATINACPHRQSQCLILRHTCNKGLPAARNTGLMAARGEYIFHCDGDDFVEAGMLMSLYNEAKSKDADIVYCDYYVSEVDKERYIHQPRCSSPEQAMKNLLCADMVYNVWNKLVRRRLYTENQICFPSGYSMGEDLTMIKLFSFARKISYLPEAFYHYVRWNSNAMTRIMSQRHIDQLKHNLTNIAQFLIDRYGDFWAEVIYGFVLQIKWPLLITNRRYYYNAWKECVREANPYIWRDRNVSLRIKCVEFWASKGWFSLIWLHYWIVCRCFYSIRYKK